ncbi:phosphoenolpyruvate synthase [Nanoarchaeota archaeon]
MDKNRRFILWFDELTIDDVPLVGGKNASLGEMYSNLNEKGVNIPNGFTITSTAYRYFIAKSNLKPKIAEILKDLDTHNVTSLAEKGEKIRYLITHSELPDELKISIKKAYKKLCSQYGHNTDVAVRSSATTEDLPDASFAGQQETFLNIKGEHALMDACKRCFASLFTNRAISYRHDKGFNQTKIYLSIGVQKMVRSDLSSSGVMFSIDTESGFKDVVFITSIWGLGENIVQGAVNPDEYYVFKPTLKKNKHAILSKRIGEKKIKMVYAHDASKTTKNIPTPKAQRESFVLNDDEILTLAKWAVIIEEHYSKKAKKFKPMDMEWAKDGKSNKLYIVQARPETVQSQKDRSVLEDYKLKKRGEILVTGKSVGSKIGAGKAHIIHNIHDISKFKKGEILVTDMTDPDWEPIMKLAAAIITNRGGRTCHAAIVSRELGVPCIVGTNHATEKIKPNQPVTASCAEGEEGYIYKGILPFEIKTTKVANIKRPKTKIMMNVANPDDAFNISFIPNDGVGLAREEFIINDYVKIHPLALINYNKIKDKAVKQKIDKRTIGYKDKVQFFIDKLSAGIAILGAAFYPNDVIVRFSDFKSNEYANLIGGKEYEPKEENPMIGWRGASRYYSPQYEPAFGLECKAIKKVREEIGLTNVKVMVPFCRTPEEGIAVQKVMKKYGLQRGKKGLEVYVMCEIPSNVMLADQFADIFDGFSIGSNDLTQLTLGLDRDSSLVSHLYDERCLAVKKLIGLVITRAKKRKKKIGICGQGPSDFPEFADFLVRLGIDSISLNPDTVVKTTLRILEVEKKLKR